MLIIDGLKAPPGTVVDENFEGMTAEEIYHYIGELDKEESSLDKQNQEFDDNNSREEINKEHIQKDEKRFHRRLDGNGYTYNK